MCDDGPFSSNRELDAWHRAFAAQVEGDHGLAERLFAQLAAADPSDAEARFQQAIEAGWAAPPRTPRFDEVIVGVAIAIERASSSDERQELRSRAARALTVLGEMKFALSQDALLDVPASSLNEALVHHLVLGAAVLRLLDAALELAPREALASEAIVRVTDDLLSRVGGPRGLRIAGVGYASGAAPIEGFAVGRARERALRHLAALARERRLADDDPDRSTLPSEDRPTIP